MEQFKSFIIERKLNEITEILNQQDINHHYSLLISFNEIYEFDPELGNLILEQPENILDDNNDMLQLIQEEIMKEPHEKQSIKKHIHIRIHSLPPLPEIHRARFPKNNDIGLYLEINGIVVRSTLVKMLEYQREYMCTSCKYKCMIKGTYEDKFLVQAPRYCPNPQFCKGTTLMQSSNLGKSNCKDYQEVKIQENISNIFGTTMPKSMWVTLEDNLVNVCKPGDNITICGIIKRRWTQKPANNRKSSMELVMKGIHIKINNDLIGMSLLTYDSEEIIELFWHRFKDAPLYARDLILRSFCPKIYGMYMVKLAIIVTLAGSTLFEHANDANEMRVRNEPHLLLVGDAGMGKSQLLRFAAQIVPRSVLTTGLGTTSAGLTATALMEDGEWQLEGGALVQADGGICCIDEFNSMKENDRVSMHEAMEQQTISVAKAGIVCKLNTRCSIIAATNPRGAIDLTQHVSENCALSSPLISRFDLILLIKDNNDDHWDGKVADYILHNHKHKSKFIEEKNAMWDVKMLTAYFAYIKRFNPTLGDKASELLSNYYQYQRSSRTTKSKATTTVRLLEALMRLSKAHARLMCRSRIDVVDAVTAIALMESAKSTEESLIEIKNFSKYVADPANNYEEVIRSLADKLNMPSLLEEILEQSVDNHESTTSKSQESNNTAIHNVTNCDNNLQIVNTVEDDEVSEDINETLKNSVFEQNGNMFGDNLSQYRSQTRSNPIFERENTKDDVNICGDNSSQYRSQTRANSIFERESASQKLNTLEPNENLNISGDNLSQYRSQVRANSSFERRNISQNLKKYDNLSQQKSQTCANTEFRKENIDQKLKSCDLDENVDLYPRCLSQQKSPTCTSQYTHDVSTNEIECDIRNSESLESCYIEETSDQFKFVIPNDKQDKFPTFKVKQSNKMKRSDDSTDGKLLKRPKLISAFDEVLSQMPSQAEDSYLSFDEPQASSTQTSVLNASLINKPANRSIFEDDNVDFDAVFDLDD